MGDCDTMGPQSPIFISIKERKKPMPKALLTVLECPHCKAQHPLLFDETAIVCKCGTTILAIHLVGDEVYFKVAEPRSEFIQKHFDLFHHYDDKILGCEPYDG